MSVKNVGKSYTPTNSVHIAHEYAQELKTNYLSTSDIFIARYTKYMQAIGELKLEFTKPTATSVRADLLNQLHEIYTEYAQDFSIKNKKRYYAYLKSRHPEVLKSGDYYKYKEEFKKAKLPEHQRFLEYIQKKDFRWWGKFSHLTGEEGNRAIEHMISVAKDKLHRKENVAQYIFGSVKGVDNQA